MLKIKEELKAGDAKLSNKEGNYQGYIYMFNPPLTLIILRD